MTGCLCEDGLVGGWGAWLGDLTLGWGEIVGADTWTAIERMVWWEARGAWRMCCGGEGRGKECGRGVRRIRRAAWGEGWGK